MLTSDQTEKIASRVGDLLTHDAQFLATLPSEDVARSMTRPGVGLVATMQLVADGYAERPALAERATRRVTRRGRSSREPLPSFQTVSYRELSLRVKALAAALRDSPVQPGDRIATVGFCGVDYTTVDMAIAWLGGVSVPLQTGATASRLRLVIDETEPSVIACSIDNLTTVVDLALHSTSATRPLILAFGYHPDVDDHREAVKAAQARLAAEPGHQALVTLTELLEQGRNLPAAQAPRPDPDRLAAIIYTSGSSGSPKGAVQPERLVQGAWSHLATAFLDRGFAIPAITLNYLPMSHTGGRAMLYSTLGAGGTAYFAAASDLSTMLEDLSLVRPTQLNLVPRVWELLHRDFLTRLGHSKAGSGSGTVQEEALLADFRTAVLGGRYISALTGSAPISPELAAWVEKLLDGHLMDALGATESGPVIVDGQLQRPPITDYKLADVPELGYFSTDRPHPRGELLIKSTSLFAGYYRRPELTAEVFDPEGFYRTGDVVAQTAPDHFRYVDRRNSVLKLSQGEFVAVTKLEAVFNDCEPVDQLYIYGNSERSYLLAVVVPTAEARERYHPDDLKAELLRSMRNAADHASLQSYEVPRDILVELSPFTLGNGLLTGVRKLARPALRERYGEQLEALYLAHDKGAQDLWRQLKEHAKDHPVLDTVCRAASAVLGLTDTEPMADAHFSDLGGDSLSALELVTTLSDLFGVEVPVSVAISPIGDLRSIAEHIETLRRPDAAGATFTSVHGSGATVVYASDLTLAKFIDTPTLSSAAALPTASPEPHAVLLTGATGYLGRYLALDWLERMARVGGKVICLVRAVDEAAAWQRLDAAFDSGDADLLARYRRLAAGHLTVVSGDKSAAFLGLDKDTWQDLAETIDLIVDPAALVNHMLPYPQLFSPNVVGTAELIRLALTTRIKPIAHVSSVAVGKTVAPAEFSEKAHIRQVSSSRQVDNGYASGYATSKWASEVLLREAHDLSAVPVTVFRCDMLMAETTCLGQLNLPDMVTRLILSIAATGLAPQSFYVPTVSGGRAPAHFDGLPVDFVARFISILNSNSPTGFHTFHVVNPHEDGVGLDEYVDWMIETGCPIERIHDYHQWYQRFESALRNLPDRQRQASILPIATSYRHPQPALNGSFVTSPHFQAAVREFGVTADGEVPHISRATIAKYLSDLKHLGLLDQ